MTDRIRYIEAYVRQTMAEVVNPDLRIGHDFKHVDCVRHNIIATAEPRVAFIKAFILKLKAEISEPVNQRVSE